MMRTLRALFINALVLFGGAAYAYTIPTTAPTVTPQAVNDAIAAYAASNLASQSALAAVQATIPTPMLVAPPVEQVTGTPGTPGTYRAGNAVQPRITRTTSTTLDAAGNATFDFSSQGPLTGPVQVMVTPVGTASVSCNRTAPTVAGNTGSIGSVSIHCNLTGAVTLTLGALTSAGASGLPLNPVSSAAAGSGVDILVLPSSGR